jgi:pilus assembly protein CpaF
MIISGGTGSGKTSTMNALGFCIPPGERIITIEDAAELQLDHPHLVSLESRPPNIEGEGEVPIRTLVRNALRMRPDRIIVGEVRGGEAFDMLQAMNTGHRGSLTTLHANSPSDALIRLESMVLMAGFDMPVSAIRRMIASAIEIVVQQDRLSDGRRVVTEIKSLDRSSMDLLEMQPHYLYDGHVGEHRPVMK